MMESEGFKSNIFNIICYFDFIQMSSGTSQGRHLAVIFLTAKLVSHPRLVNLSWKPSFFKSCGAIHPMPQTVADDFSTYHI